jgi:hypothetical protein
VPTDLPGHGDNEPVIPGLSPTPEPVDAGKGGGLSKGALAGVVVGSILGAAVVLGLALLYYREKQKKERLERQRDSGRGVAWGGEDAAPPAGAAVKGKDSGSLADTFRLSDISGGRGRGV